MSGKVNVQSRENAAALLRIKRVNDPKFKPLGHEPKVTSLFGTNHTNADRKVLKELFLNQLPKEDKK